MAASWEAWRLSLLMGLMSCRRSDVLHYCKHEPQHVFELGVVINKKLFLNSEQAGHWVLRANRSRPGDVQMSVWINCRDTSSA